MSHLLLDDDVLILYDVSKEKMKYLRWIFMWFEAISGLMINLEKSSFLLGRLPTWKSLLGSWVVVWESFLLDILAFVVSSFQIKSGLGCG